MKVEIVVGHSIMLLRTDLTSQSGQQANKQNCYAAKCITIAAKCNTNPKCNNISAKCNKIFNAKCNNFPTQNVITFLMQNVITQIVITPELQVCST